MSTAITSGAFSITAISSDLAKRVRETLLDDFGNTLEVQGAGSVPCRHCLRLTVPGEHVILFAYKPFTFSGPYAEVGPVFIHAQECGHYLEAAFPRDFRERVLTMRGYNGDHRIESAELSAAGAPEASISRLFANDRVRFIHVRNPAWGCYDFQVDRC